MKGYYYAAMPKHAIELAPPDKVLTHTSKTGAHYRICLYSKYDILVVLKDGSTVPETVFGPINGLSTVEIVTLCATVCP